MDSPRPTKSRKGQKALSRPFYETDGQTSANIVSEARSSLRSLETKRPFTPVESKRTLFRSSPPRPYEGRPPSAFSLGSYQSEGESRPPSGRRLTPIENVPQILHSESVLPSPPPSGKSRRAIRASLSSPLEDLNAEQLSQKLQDVVSNQPEKDPQLEHCPSPPKKGSPSKTSVADTSRQNSAASVPTPPAVPRDGAGTRRVRSGPKERSSPTVNALHRIKSSPLERRDQDSDLSSEAAERHKKGSERAGSGDKRKKKAHHDDEKQKDELAIYYEDNVKPLLCQMEQKFADRNVKELCQDCLKLWNVLEKKGFIGKASGSFSARRRGEILRTVFKFLDLSEPRLLLRLGRLILSMKVTGNNLTNICMVVYKVAKTEQNDQLFLEENILSKSCLFFYCVQALKNGPSGGERQVNGENKGPNKNEEVLIKGIRVIANLSINEEAGAGIAANEPLVDLLIQILDVKDATNNEELVLNTVATLNNLSFYNDADSVVQQRQVEITEMLISLLLPENMDAMVEASRVFGNFSRSKKVRTVLAKHKDVKDATNNEELVLNTVATLNNLSFYNDADSVVQQRQVEITEMLISLLLPENMDAMVEASRVFGNFSRSKKVRTVLAKHKVDEIMMALLDAGERETVFTVCGVLINLMSDEELKPKLKDEDGIKNWQMSSMVCQILWNYSDKITSSTETFGEQETLELIDILTQYLDEDTALDPAGVETAESNILEVLRDMWEEQFVPVAQHLLQRLKTHHTDLVPLESPS
ncbi:PREDICTED: armadillo repeat-containing protein 2-like [Acropora digitifera]|uniref:armadillo repeat-containing protein 2-like n=1 Tax=Acropora digitifera TaxID=70779 RepID=UPI00077A3F32|nr:PREDICTED: armadillo repeat-containing protein 2-like [Acropora digitifera]